MEKIVCVAWRWRATFRQSLKVTWAEGRLSHSSGSRRPYSASTSRFESKRVLGNLRKGRVVKAMGRNDGGKGGKKGREVGRREGR